MTPVVTTPTDRGQMSWARIQDSLDGVAVRVQARATYQLRLWVAVQPWRLYNHLSSRTVEALGLDPMKGVMVMLTTDQHYTLSTVRPEVKWVRQVHPDKMEGSMRCDGSVGDTFSLEWMLRKRLEEDLSRNWPPAPRCDRSPEDKRDAGTRAREEGLVCKNDERKCSKDTIRRMCECTGVVEELAVYALQVSQDDEQQAHNLLLDMAELQNIFEVVEQMVLLHAAAAHPRNKELQCDFVCQVETGERPSSWTIPSPPPLTTEDEGEERLGRTAELENAVETTGNLLLRVALTIMAKIRNANKICLVCGNAIEGYLPAVPIVCPKELCVMSSEEMGCGTDVRSQVEKKGETVDLLIDLFYMAMHGRRPELAFPSTVQLGAMESGKSDEQKVREILATFPTVEGMRRSVKRIAEERKVGSPSSSSSSSSSPCWDEEANVADGNMGDIDCAKPSSSGAVSVAAAVDAAVANNIDEGDTESAAEAVARAEAIAAVEAVATAEAIAAAEEAAAAQAVAAKEAAADAAMGGVVAGSLLGIDGAEGHYDAEADDGGKGREEWNPLSYAYPLLRWLLSATRAHLRPLREDEIIREIPCAKQFMLVTGTAEREANFQRLKREAASNGRTGSFFAFHGSKPDNWHAILQLGLKNMSGSKYMSSGAAYGKGIYMADMLSVSLGYAASDGTEHWPLGKTSGMAVIVAVCEVVDRPHYKKANGCFVVPDDECVATRFLLIDPSPTGGGAISASKLALNLQV
ncbi:unnamed protein product [Ectocarpus sp. 4 AP-2014]